MSLTLAGTAQQFTSLLMMVIGVLLILDGRIIDGFTHRGEHAGRPRVGPDRRNCRSHHAGDTDLSHRFDRSTD